MRQPLIVVTGVGLVTALGWSAAQTWSAMRRGLGGLRPITLFSTKRWSHVPVGQAPRPPDNAEAGGSRSLMLAQHATHEALEQACLLHPGGAADDRRSGIALGACTGGLLETESAIQDVLSHRVPRYAELVRGHLCSTVTDHLAERFGIEGPRATVSDACASGASAIATGCDWLTTGQADRVLCGGVDVLTRLTLNGFGSLLILDEAGCRPFDVERRGMSLGEGAGMLVLETAESARSRGVRGLGRVAGWACTCDAFHATGPEPGGLGVSSAMTAALHMADIDPRRVGYVNTHGTGTVENDRSEASAMRRVFGEAIPPFSSIKGYMGHTLGAAGAIEAVACLLTMKQGLMPPNFGMRTPDPDLGVTPLHHWQRTQTDIALSNAMGFGGVNTTLMLVNGNGN